MCSRRYTLAQLFTFDTNITSLWSLAYVNQHAPLTTALVPDTDISMRLLNTCMGCHMAPWTCKEYVAASYGYLSIEVFQEIVCHMVNVMLPLSIP